MGRIRQARACAPKKCKPPSGERTLGYSARHAAQWPAMNSTTTSRDRPSVFACIGGGVSEGSHGGGFCATVGARAVSARARARCIRA